MGVMHSYLYIVVAAIGMGFEVDFSKVELDVVAGRYSDSPSTGSIDRVVSRIAWAANNTAGLVSDIHSAYYIERMRNTGY